MKKINLILFFLVALSFVSEVHAKSISEIKYVYMFEAEQGSDMGNQAYELSPVDVKVADSPLTILPYATVELKLKIASQEELDEFMNNMRIIDVDDGNAELRHIDEVIGSTGLPVMSFEVGGYEVVTGILTVYYTPSEGLEPGHQYRIQVPDGWEAPSNTEFVVKNLTNTLPVYNIIIPNSEDWEHITRPESNMGADTPFVPCIFYDVSNIKDTFNPIYRNAEVRVRGYYSRTAPKKNLTIKFDDSQLFNGFKDSSGVHQGNRKRIVFVANMVSFKSGETNKTFVNNKLSYDLLRKVDERVYGAGLAPDSYFGLLAINGRFWGLYNIAEHIDVGVGGWNTMKDRREKIFKDPNFLNNEGAGLLHKVTWEGKLYPEFGKEYRQGWPGEDPEVTPYFGIAPQTEHKYRLLQEGDGSRTRWEETIPFPVYTEMSRDQWGQLLDPERIADLEFEVKAKWAKSDSYPKMELNPDLDRYSQSTWQPDFDPQLVYLTGDGAGTIRLNEDSARFSVDFSNPVYTGKPVNAYYYSTFDYDQFYKSVTQGYSGMFDWMNLDSILIHIFFVRLAQSGDNVTHNYYQFANYWNTSYGDSRYMNLGDYRDVLVPPKNQLGEVAKYYQVVWDCDLAFPQDQYGGWWYTEDSFPLDWKIALHDEDAAQRYVNIFYPETLEGGILRKEYYIQKIDEYIAEIADAEMLEEIRWQRELDIPYLKEYFSFLTSFNREIWETDLVTLQFDSEGRPKYKPPYGFWVEMNPIPEQTVEVGKPLFIEITPKDPEERVWIYEIIKTPDLPGLTQVFNEFGPSMNVLQITPQENDGGQYYVSVNVLNNKGMGGNVWFKLNIMEPAQMLTPTVGTILNDTPTFTWDAGAGVTQYSLKVTQGTTLIYDKNLGTSKSATISGTPQINLNGSTISVQLGSLINGTWSYSNYTYQVGKPARIITPAAGSVFYNSQTFTWDAGVGVSQYGLSVNTAKYNNQNLGTSKSVTVPGIPLDGNQVVATLASLINGKWYHVSFVWNTVLGLEMVVNGNFNLFSYPNISGWIVNGMWYYDSIGKQIYISVNPSNVQTVVQIAQPSRGLAIKVGTSYLVEFDAKAYGGTFTAAGTYATIGGQKIYINQAVHYKVIVKATTTGNLQFVVPANKLPSLAIDNVSVKEYRTPTPTPSPSPSPSPTASPNTAN